MKTSCHALSGPFLALSLLLAAGCSKKETPAPATTVEPKPAPAPATNSAVAVTPAPVVTIDPTVEMKTALAAATLENQAGLGSVQQRMDQQIDAQVAAKRAAADVTLDATSKLDLASDDFAEKLRMLSLARPETWTNTKHDTEIALQKVQAAYLQVMNSPARR